MSRRLSTLLVLRFLAVANIVLLGVVGTLYLLFAGAPQGEVVAGVLWGVAALLVLCVPLTEPYRHERVRRSRRRPGAGRGRRSRGSSRSGPPG